MLGLTTTRRLRAELAAAKSETERMRRQRDRAIDEGDAFREAARTAARQVAEADAANRRLAGRNLELGVRLSAYAESDPEYLAMLEQRLARALRACARYRTAAHSEQHRADVLQQRLDDACVLNRAEVAEGRNWQHTRQDGGRKRVAS